MKKFNVKLSVVASLGLMLLISNLTAAQAIAISDNEKYLAAGNNETTGIWNMTDGAKTTTAEGYFAAFSANGEKFATEVAASDQSVTKLWNTGTSAPAGAFAGRFVALSQDGKWLVTNHSQDGIRLWDASSGEVVRTLVAGPIELATLAVSPDFSWLAIHRPGAPDLEIINVADAKLAHKVSLGTHPEIEDLADITDALGISPNGNLLAYSFGNQWDIHRILVVDASTGKEVSNFKGTMGAGPAVHFDPSGTMIVSDGNMVDLWDARSGRLIRTFNLSPILYRVAEWGTSSDVSRDGKLLTVDGPENRKMMFNFATGREVRWFRTRNPQSYQFSPNGKSLAIMDANGIVTLRNAATGKLIRQLAKTGIK